MISIVPLSQLEVPLLPGTPAFSVVAAPDCRKHIDHPASLLKGVGRVNGSVRLSLFGKRWRYQELVDTHTTFWVDEHNIRTPNRGYSPGGRTIAVFGSGCACRVVPCRVTSFGWMNTAGLQFEPLGRNVQQMALEPKAWLMVRAGWNEPVKPQSFRPGNRIVIFHRKDGELQRATFGKIHNGLVTFSDAGALELDHAGVTYWLYHEVNSVT